MKNKRQRDLQNINLSPSDEFLKNEYRTNKIVSFFLLGFVIIGIVNVILLRIDNVLDLIHINHIIFLPINSLLVCMVILSWFFNFAKPWIKYMLLSGIILVTTISFFAFTTYTIYLLFIPIFISARYFNHRIITAVSIVTALLFVSACILNVFLETESDIIVKLHKSSSYNPWHYYTDAVVYIIVPCLLALIFLWFFAANMTSSGRRLIASKIESTQKIAAVDAEIDMAAQIQKSVLPHRNFTTPDGNFKLYAYESPAKEVCGDFYDYFMLNNDILAVIVADVSDKGMSAAMFMMSAKKALQCALLSRNNLEEAILLANRLICNDNQYGMFLTIWMGVIDTKSGIGKYINAGHPFPILKTNSGKIEFISNEPDLFIGNFPERTPRVNTFSMNPQDTLLIYTDGLTDATNSLGKSYNIEGILNQIKSSQNNAEEIISNLKKSVHLFTADNTPFDDITMLVLQCTDLDSPKIIHLTEETGIEGTAKINNTILEILKQTDCPDEKRRNIGVTVDEICNNISEYAYPDKIGKIDFSASLYHNGLKMTFADTGIPFNPLLHESDTSDTLQIGGLGIYFVKQLADNISYEYKDNNNLLNVSFIWGI